MRWIKKNSPSANISILKVELLKAEIRINDLQHRIMELKKDNDILNKRIEQFCTQVELGINQDDLWDAIEILRGQR